ncbi:hypothetical protein [Pelosinus sp. sgz500959]|uniref:hypothetical protein n=1 Tax=Pelosinus sp. sgz500959 TaxID=3242472 RepID=UPI003672ADB0
MAYVIGCLMASLSFLLNKLLLQYIGNRVIVSYGPIFEELAKTLCSYYLGADILVTHIIFGILEAAYDWFKNSSRERRGLAALSSIVGHGLFGGLTVGVFYLSGSILGGIFIAVCVHLIWNVTVIRLSA